LGNSPLSSDPFCPKRCDPIFSHVALEGESVQGQRIGTIRLSTAVLQNEVRRIVWEDLSDHPKQITSGTQITKEPE